MYDTSQSWFLLLLFFCFPNLLMDHNFCKHFFDHIICFKWKDPFKALIIQLSCSWYYYQLIIMILLQCFRQLLEIEYSFPIFVCVLSCQISWQHQNKSMHASLSNGIFKSQQNIPLIFLRHCSNSDMLRTFLPWGSWN